MTNSNNTAKSDRLNRAIDRVDATDVGDGDWAYWADETRRYYIVSETELESLCDYLDDEDEQISSDAYSHWCAGTMSREMPKEWEPGMDLDATEDTIAFAALTDPVIVEVMPDHLCASHRAARNWGVYPANGAERRIVERSDAEDIVSSDDDNYAHIVRAAKPSDAEKYSVGQ